MPLPAFDISSRVPDEHFLDQLERLIVYWLGPRLPEYGVPVEVLTEYSLPDPLRRFYGFAGRWPTVSIEYAGGTNAFSTQDSLRPIEETCVENGKLIFIDENQGVWRAATEPTGSAPRVWVSGEAGFKPDNEWLELPCTLSHLIGGFAAQELVLGSRMCTANKRLVSSLKSRLAETTPIWTQIPYVYQESDRRLWLIEPDILVINMGQSFWFAGNTPEAIDYLNIHLGAYHVATIIIPSGWQLEIRHDGSGEFSVVGDRGARGSFPVGTFNLAEIVDRLVAHLDENTRSSRCHVFLKREGDGYSRGRSLQDAAIATTLVKTALLSITDKSPTFDTMLRAHPVT